MSCTVVFGDFSCPMSHRMWRSIPASGIAWLHFTGVETEAGWRSCDSWLPFSRRHSVFLKSPEPQETAFFFLLERRASGCVCRECQWRALFAAGFSSTFEPALNFLRPGSGLGKYSRGSLWYRQAELCPTAFALAFIAQYFLVYFFSAAQLGSQPPLPCQEGITRFSIHVGEGAVGEGSRQLPGSWLEVAGPGSTTIPHFSQLSCQQELCFPRRLRT